MGGDGNCLFRSVADQLHGDQTLHKKYRAATVEYMLANKEEYIPFMNENDPIEKYCKRLSKDKTWGGQHELRAMAMKYHFNVYLHQVGKSSLIHKFHDSEPIENVPIIHLSYHRASHYNSVRRIDDPKKKSIPPLPISHDLKLTKQIVDKKRLTP